MALYQSKIGLQTINAVLGIGLSHRLRVAQSHGWSHAGLAVAATDAEWSVLSKINRNRNAVVFASYGR